MLPSNLLTFALNGMQLTSQLQTDERWPTFEGILQNLHSQGIYIHPEQLAEFLLAHGLPVHMRYVPPHLRHKAIEINENYRGDMVRVVEELEPPCWDFSWMDNMHEPVIQNDGSDRVPPVEESGNVAGAEASGLTPEQYQRKMQRRKEVQEERLARASQEKGLIIVNTGNGKGKTTAALGMVLRSLGHGYRVAIVQFIKGAWEPAEKATFQHWTSAEPGQMPQLEFHAMGEGFTWETQDRERDIEKAQAAWEKALGFICNPEFRLVLLDEVNVALKLGYLNVQDVLAGLKQKPADSHVILTGRGAPPELIERADLVTEMTLVKHPFREQGVKAQPGIEF
jgi:cob(I)alamin adenosyltransferase